MAAAVAICSAIVETMSQAFTNNALLQQQVKAAADRSAQEIRTGTDSSPAAVACLKHKAPQLPTVSKSFFHKGSAVDRSTEVSKSYIFFDPRLKLKPYRINPSRDFITPPPPTLPPLPTPPQSLSPPSVTTTSTMTRPAIERNEKQFVSLKAIREKATISDDAFKDFAKDIEDFVKDNEVECQKKPRMWSKENWKKLGQDFIEAGAGEKYWTTQRTGFNVENDYMYPEDKIE